MPTAEQAEGARIRIAIIDDLALLAETLGTTLETRDFDTTIVSPTGRTGAEVLAAVKESRATVVLLDLHLGDGVSGTALVAPLVAIGMLVVVLTAVASPEEVELVTAAGATAILHKGVAFGVLLDRIEALTGRRPRGGRHLFDQLTPTQSYVMGELVRGRVAGEIAADQGVSMATVRTHIRGILMKLGVQSQVAAVAEARRTGWRPD